MKLVQSKPPEPTGGSLFVWAGQLYRWLVQQQMQQNVAKPIRLAYLTSTDKPTVDGILMFDPSIPGVVVSVGGAWVQI